MQVEVKILLMDTSDYQILTKALAPLFLREESYCDFFFDFEDKTLAERDSVVRLRVPCETPNSKIFPIFRGSNFFSKGLKKDYSGSLHTSVTGDSSYENFLISCQGPNPIREQMEVQEQQRAAACKVGLAGDRSSRVCRSDPCNLLSPRVELEFNTDSFDQNEGICLIPDTCGKLVLKQNNTVTDGCQLNFILEDSNVPPDVVKDLIKECHKKSDHKASRFRVLEQYAARRLHEFLQQQSQRKQESHSLMEGEPPILRIVERLRSTSHQIQDKTLFSQPKANALGNSDNHHYSQVRHAVGTHAQDNATTEGDESHTFPLELTHVGRYVSTRRTYRYLPDISGIETRSATNRIFPHKNASISGSVCAKEQTWRDHLRIRIDKTFYPFGEKYELEVSHIDAPLEDEILGELRTLLDQLQVKFCLGSESKYARFIRGVRNEQLQLDDVQDVKLRLSSLSGYKEVKKNLERVMLSTQTGHSTVTDINENRGIDGTHKRQRKDHDLLPNAMVSADNHVCELSASDLTEFQEDYFFDGPDRELYHQKCFLRLRWYNRSAHYTLVLKEDQSFKDGQQSSRTSKVEPSAEVARALVQNPQQFLVAEHQHNAVARRLWDYFGLRSLRSTVSFTTTRITVPWLSAQSQPPSSEYRAATSALGASFSQGIVSSQRVPASMLVRSVVKPSLHFSNIINTSAAHECSANPMFEALQIHLDRTQYLLPAGVGKDLLQPTRSLRRAQTTSTSQFTPSYKAHEICEVYEIEVTNIMHHTSPSAIMEELTGVLDAMGVEWQPGIKSKLDQYYALLSSAQFLQTSLQGE